MTDERKAKPTLADIAAAKKLKLLWLQRASSLGITQDTAAENLGITQGAISQYLNGKIPMNYRTLLMFCRLLGIDDIDIRDDLLEQRLLSDIRKTQPISAKDKELLSAYRAASPATQAAVDMLLMPPDERAALKDANPLAYLGIELLEGHGGRSDTAAPIRKIA